MTLQNDFLIHYQNIQPSSPEGRLVISEDAALFFRGLAESQKQSRASTNHFSQYSEATGFFAELMAFKALGVSGEQVYAKFTNSLGKGDGGTDYKNIDFKGTTTRNPIYFTVSKSNRYRSRARVYFLTQLEHRHGFVQGNLLGWVHRADIIPYLREVALRGKTFYRWRFDSVQRDGFIRPLSDRSFLEDGNAKA